MLCCCNVANVLIVPRTVVVELCRERQRAGWVRFGRKGRDFGNGIRGRSCSAIVTRPLNVSQRHRRSPGDV